MSPFKEALRDEEKGAEENSHLPGLTRRGSYREPVVRNNRQEQPERTVLPVMSKDKGSMRGLRCEKRQAQEGHGSWFPVPVCF